MYYKLYNYCSLRLRFDYQINQKGKVPIFIELDGRQHFSPVRFGKITQKQSEENFILQQKYDTIKNEFCKINNYNLLRISYKDFNNIIDNIVTNFIQTYYK
jgi:very-short-patch-repair endonuclease